MSLTVGLKAYRTPFAAPLATGRGLWSYREGAWVVVRDADGHLGLGEIAPLPDWGTEPLDAAIAALPASGPSDLSPAAWGIDPRRTPAAWAGLELAIMDYKARRLGITVARLLAHRLDRGLPKAAVPVNRLLTAEAPEALTAEAREAVAAGYRTVKLKVGGRDLATDVARLEAVRLAVGPTVALRLDANGSWTREEARGALAAFAPYSPDYVEQPVAIADREGLVALRRETGVTTAADEAAGSPEAAEASLKAGVGVLVVKPAAVGGLQATADIHRVASAAGARVVVTSALDRGVATAGALHLAAALGLEDAAGLSTAGMFAAPAVAPPRFDAGALWLPATEGLGLEVLDPELKEFADGHLARS